jgi:hypothetical protein
MHQRQPAGNRKADCTSVLKFCIGLANERRVQRRFRRASGDCCCRTVAEVMVRTPISAHLWLSTTDTVCFVGAEDPTQLLYLAINERD